MTDRKLVIALLSAAAAIGALACGRRQSEPKRDEADNRRRVDKLAEAVRAADLEAVMSNYAPDLVTFDIVPPLQKVGAAGKRTNWMDVFTTYQRPLGYEIRDLSITVGDDVAFGYSLNRLSGALKNGNKVEQWLRWTACFRKLDGIWLIVHDHVSVPTDFATGKALLELRP